MTLTSLLPTMRHSIPSPFTRDAWPARTVPTLDDVVMAGVSILRFVDLCGTPCATTGSAILPLSGGIASTTESTTVVTTAVVAVDHAGTTPVLLFDAVLTGVAPCWAEARLIGRISSRHDRRYGVRDAAGDDLCGVAIVLPEDLAAGDLVTVPVPGAHTVGELRARGGR